MDAQNTGGVRVGPAVEISLISGSEAYNIHLHGDGYYQFAGYIIIQASKILRNIQYTQSDNDLTSRSLEKQFHIYL